MRHPSSSYFFQKWKNLFKTYPALTKETLTFMSSQRSPCPCKTSRKSPPNALSVCSVNNLNSIYRSGNASIMNISLSLNLHEQLYSYSFSITHQVCSILDRSIHFAFPASLSAWEQSILESVSVQTIMYRTIRIVSFLQVSLYLEIFM